MPPAGVSPGGETMRHVVVHTIARCVCLLHERTILMLVLLFCLGVGGMLWDVSRLQSNLITSIALQDASHPRRMQIMRGCKSRGLACGGRLPCRAAATASPSARHRTRIAREGRWRNAEDDDGDG